MSPDFILHTAARLYGLSAQQITGLDKERRFVWPRMAAMAMSRKRSRVSLLQIGETFRRSSVSVWKAERRVPQLIKTHRGFRDLYALFDKILESDMHIYISGPEGDRHAEAYRTTAALIDQQPDWCAVNPYLTSEALRWQRGFNSLSLSHQHAILRRAALRNLLGCEALVQIAGWKSNAGAKLEYKIAQDCNIQIFPTLHDFLNARPTRKPGRQEEAA